MLTFFGIITLLLFVSVVIIRSRILKKQGIKSIEFGGKDKKDFFIIPFAFFYFYLIIANTFRLPTVPGQVLFHHHYLASLGVILCLIALSFFIWTMISFKKSFRVGLVSNTEQGLIKTGAFAISRNPIYICFALMLTGQFLIFPSWILLIYIFLGSITFHCQVLKEEIFLQEEYGPAFYEYCDKVRRYI